MNRRITYIKQFADEVDMVLEDKLSEKKLKRLITLVRGTTPWSTLGVTTIEECNPPTHRKRLVVAKEIIAMYQEAGVVEKDWAYHWEYYSMLQKEIRNGYKSMARPPRQDNKTYVNTSPSPFATNKNKIRYPRKARKTAWKRFYRLFPHLMPQN